MVKLLNWLTTVVVETMSGKLKMERSAISMEMSAALAKK